MDGTNRSVIVEDKITWPNGLTLDFINDRIYWADAREDYIEFASLDGTNRHTGNARAHAQTQITAFAQRSSCCAIIRIGQNDVSLLQLDAR